MRRSLIHGRVDPARSQEGVEASVDEVASVESAGETLWSWEEFGWQVLLLCDLCAILLVGSLVDEVLGQRLRRILDLLGLRGEAPRHDISLLNLSSVALDSSVDLRVELAVLTHFLERLVLVCADGVLQSQVSRALKLNQNESVIVDKKLLQLLWDHEEYTCKVRAQLHLIASELVF